MKYIEVLLLLAVALGHVQSRHDWPGFHRYSRKYINSPYLAKLMKLNVSASSIDPEAFMGFCEISNYHGYNCAEYLHEVVTEDGYLLTLHRINGRKGEKFPTPRPPVFVQHGLLCDSTSWILNFPNQSLPFILSDAGYDVWLGNSRGNTYSRAHKTLKQDTDAFWAWSWDEMAMYDLPASIDFVINHTNVDTIPYIGHSQGTLIAFAHLSSTPGTKISQMIALGPVFKVAHMISPLKLLFPFTKELEFLFKILGWRDFLPNDWILKMTVDNLCDPDDPLYFLCSEFLFSIVGFDSKQLNETRVAVYLNHAPAGTSVRNCAHFAQMYGSKNCSRYNFGSAKENMKHYGVSTPPSYDITRIKKTPISIFWAENDWLADTADVQYIIHNLPTLQDDVYIANWDHLDFIWGLDANTLVYDKVVSMLKKNTS